MHRARARRRISSAGSHVVILRSRFGDDLDPRSDAVPVALCSLQLELQPMIVARTLIDPDLRRGIDRASPPRRAGRLHSNLRWPIPGAAKAAATSAQPPLSALRTSSRRDCGIRCSVVPPSNSVAPAKIEHVRAKRKCLSIRHCQNPQSSENIPPWARSTSSCCSRESPPRSCLSRCCGRAGNVSPSRATTKISG